MRFIVVGIVLSVASTSMAESDPPDKPKSEALAIAATAAGTVVAASLAIRFPKGDVNSGTEAYLSLAGIIALPSLGHAYAEDWAWVGIGAGSRVAGFALIMWGTQMDRTIPGCNQDFDDGCSRTGLAKNLISAGIITMLASPIVELFHAPYSAHKFNKRHAMTIAPTSMPGGGGGVVLGGTF